MNLCPENPIPRIFFEGLRMLTRGLLMGGFVGWCRVGVGIVELGTEGG